MTKIIAKVKTTTRPFNDWSSSTLISLNLLIWFVMMSISIIMLGLLPFGSSISSLITSKLNETLDLLRSCLGSWRSLEQSKVCPQSVWIFVVIGGKIMLSSPWLLFPPSIRTHWLWSGGCYSPTQLHNIQRGSDSYFCIFISLGFNR